MLGLVAAGVFPLVGVIGGGIDMSRSYLAKTQLQAACDAGALAGRRAMARADQYETPERAKADRLFAANFDGTRFGVADPVFTTTVDGDDNILGSATVDVPTTLMAVFGKKTVTVSVDCMATLQVSNTDVMFVLDTTGSMEGDKISGLRDAVRDFHSVLAGADLANSTRVRYGFVPYALTVNASTLLGSSHIPSTAFSATTPTQTRVAVFDNPETINSYGDFTDTGTTEQQANPSFYYYESTCNDYGNNYGDNPTFSGNTRTTYSFNRFEHVGTQFGRKYGRCWRNRTNAVAAVTSRTIWKPTRYVYQEANLDTSDYRGRGSVEFANSLTTTNSWVDAEGTYDMVQLAAKQDEGTAGGIGTTSSSWDGCIMERTTVQDADFDPIPNGARDHDIVSAAVDGTFDTQWRPMWVDLTYNRSGNRQSTTTADDTHACPARMVPFTQIDMTSLTVPTWLDTYLDNELSAEGFTYHDIGMIWGARLASPRGILQANVSDQPNRPTTRHIIFMTDGSIDTRPTALSAYGYEGDRKPGSTLGVVGTDHGILPRSALRSRLRLGEGGGSVHLGRRVRNHDYRCHEIVCNRLAVVLRKRQR